MSPTNPTDAQAEAVRALAHPLRNRLLTALRAGGPATATDLAAALGTNTGATSYHLRRLAEAGLVEDTGAGTGRRRQWRAAPAYHRALATDLGEDDDAQSALNWIERDYVRHLSDKSNQWLDDQPGWPLAWRSALGPSDEMVLATAEQLADLREEVAAVIRRFRRVGQGDPAARRVSVWTVLYPIDLQATPDRTPRVSRRLP